jgi:ABC-2 type transport system ATP-binding protein
MSELAIETDQLVKVYPSRFFRQRAIKALSGVSLRVPRGAKFGLLGANGAGKTTFVKLLVSAVHATSGSALLFGRDARLPAARLPVGYLPENHRFPTYFTGRTMLDFHGSLSGMDSADRRKRIPELLERVGLREWADVRIRKYSKGMLQRLGLAQALMHRPQLLLLDEPTDGVDPIGRREIRDLLNGLTDTGVTVFINSHLLSEVEAFCDYVAILRRGELALEGRITDLIAGGGYRITASDVPEGLLLPRSFVRAGDGIEVSAGSREEANNLIDMLRSAGAMIESVSASSSSLEELFVQTTRQGSQAA